ncbi:MAG: Holliday junction branch migration DNA helicase RuvB [Nitrospinota bacterium]
MARERIVMGEPLSVEEEAANAALRPRRLGEFVGHRPLVERLRIAIEAALQRGEPVDHIIFYGPPGLGKTTLAHIVAHEMGAPLVTASGPAITRPADLMGILTNLEAGGVLFLDEIHRLPVTVEEFLFPALEDFQVDFIIDKGPFAKKINIPIPPFTLIGATTRAGLLSAPLRGRFGILHHLDFYPPEDLAQIIRRSAALLDFPFEPEAAGWLAVRSRGTPRVANRLLRRVRDYAEVKADGRLTLETITEALNLEGIDEAGLDQLDRRVLGTLLGVYQGGPVGIEALAATLNEEPDTLTDLVEPFLLKKEFLIRTPQGRRITDAGRRHLGHDPSAQNPAPPISSQGSLTFRSKGAG